jgi:photosystem II Psb27 protein
MSLLGGGATTGLLLVLSLIEAGAAVADGAEDYKNETQEVIDQVKATLDLDKTDPRKAEAVANLRHISNDWVAKYRRDKKVAGKPSFSNMYSVVNAIAGHYISFGPTYPIPVKRRDRILDEVKDAEKALSRGR